MAGPVFKRMENKGANNTGNEKKSQRIAANSFVLFVRMFFITIINLYSVRLVLDGLGAEDYGIFNAVAGVVMMSSFVSGVMELSIQRFYSIALGRNDEKSLNEIFSISIKILFVLAVVLLLLFESVGIWFLETKLNIPETRMYATRLCFQFSLFAFVLSIMQIPFSSAIFARENMGCYALVSSIDCVLKVIVASLIGVVMADSLVFYSGGLLLVAFVVFLMYSIYCSKNYKECRYQRVKNATLAKKLLSFSGWTLFGSVSKVCMIQGNTILLNIYFGPLVNVAFAISQQINNAFNALCNSMVLAMRPAMIKSYAEGNYEYLNKLFSACNKFIYYVLLIVSLPMISEMDTILHLWLGNSVTPQILLFSRLIIVYVVCLAINNPITTIIQASGHIKYYHLSVESITLLCLPVSWMLFKFGLQAEYVFVSMIGVCVLTHFVRLVCLRYYYPAFSLSDYFCSLCLPALLITVAGCLFTYFVSGLIYDDILSAIVVFVSEPCLVGMLVLVLGLNADERRAVSKMLKKISKKFIK